MDQDPSSKTPVALFVDDDVDVLTTAQVLLERHGFKMLSARSPAAAWSVLAEEPVDVVLLDLNFAQGATSGAEGFAWLSEIRAQDPGAVVVVVTGHSGVNIAVAAMKAGASDFVMKPWNNARFLETLRAAVALRRSRRRDKPETPLREEVLMIGESPAVRRVREIITRVAPSRAAVLIQGEAGTGKSLAARLIHARAGRGGPFARLDARSVTSLSEIDAVVAAGGPGTLFVNDLGALSPAAQARLLARLQEGDTRIVSAVTGADALSGLREDLLDRLSTVELHLPPLAARDDDLILLLEHFVRFFCRRDDRPPKPVDPAVFDLLRAQPPPRQVAGLRQATERAVALSQGDVLTPADFLSREAAAAPAAGDFNLARSERAMVLAALKRHGHNVSHAARELGLTRAALYRRMVKHGL